VGLDGYPHKRPSVRFLSRVYHPLVGENGELNLDNEFPRAWKRGEHWIQHILWYIRTIFLHIDTRKADNEEAAILYDTEMENFLGEVAGCVQESVKSVYKPMKDSSFQFSEFQGYHDSILKKYVNQFDSILPLRCHVGLI